MRRNTLFCFNGGFNTLCFKADWWNRCNWVRGDKAVAEDFFIFMVGNNLLPKGDLGPKGMVRFGRCHQKCTKTKFCVLVLLVD